MKVLGIFGSPRRQGNSDILMKAFLQGAAAGRGAGGRDLPRGIARFLPVWKYIIVLRMAPALLRMTCGSCMTSCWRPTWWPWRSPVFFYGVSAQAKAMIDRTQALWARRYVLKQDFPGGHRQGVLLAVGATKGRLLFVGARLTAKYFFDAINVRYAAEILVRGVDEKGAINDQPEVLEEARDLGRRLAQGEVLGPIKMDPLAV